MSRQRVASPEYCLYMALLGEHPASWHGREDFTEYRNGWKAKCRYSLMTGSSLFTASFFATTDQSNAQMDGLTSSGLQGRLPLRRVEAGDLGIGLIRSCKEGCVNRPGTPSSGRYRHFAFQPLAVLGKILPDRGHDARMLTQQGHGIGIFGRCHRAGVT